jgi:hypothetical protein
MVVPCPWHLVSAALAGIGLAACAGCGRQEDAGTVLEAMARAYRQAPAYSDDAHVLVEETRGDTTTDRRLPFRVAFVRPDRLRVDAYDAQLAADGDRLRAAVGDAPGQVLVAKIASPLTLDQCFADRDLTAALTEGEAGCPTQLPLLLADDTLALILADASEPPELTGVETVEGHACDRVAIPKPAGRLVLWIDRESRLLRRMEVPATGYAEAVADRGRGTIGARIVVDYRGAAFAPPAEAAFAFEVPPGAVEVTRLEPPRPPQPVSPLVGRPAAGWSLADADGEPVSPDALRGAIAVLEFFFDGCEPCTRTMPQVGAAVNGFVAAHAGAATPVPVRHRAVSVDEADVGVPALGKRLAEYGGVGTLLRDVRGAAAAALGVEEFPTVVILAPDGTIADVQVGEHNRIGADVRATLDALAAGRDTLPLLRGRHAARVQAYREELQRVGDRLGGVVAASRCGSSSCASGGPSRWRFRATSSASTRRTPGRRGRGSWPSTAGGPSWPSTPGGRNWPATNWLCPPTPPSASCGRPATPPAGAGGSARPAAASRCSCSTIAGACTRPIPRPMPVPMTVSPRPTSPTPTATARRRSPSASWERSACMPAASTAGGCGATARRARWSASPRRHREPGNSYARRPMAGWRGFPPVVAGPSCRGCRGCCCGRSPRARSAWTAAGR